MRLIDADKMKESIDFYTKDLCCEDLVPNLPRIIDEVPAADAIPVEWLNKHKTEYLDDWGENPVTVEQALKMWQKEQEAR